VLWVIMPLEPSGPFERGLAPHDERF
jgi:hypothetical protein